MVDPLSRWMVTPLFRWTVPAARYVPAANSTTPVPVLLWLAASIALSIAGASLVTPSAAAPKPLTSNAVGCCCAWPMPAPPPRTTRLIAATAASFALGANTCLVSVHRREFTGTETSCKPFHGGGLDQARSHTSDESREPLAEDDLICGPRIRRHRVAVEVSVLPQTRRATALRSRHATGSSGRSVRGAGVRVRERGCGRRTAWPVSDR